MRKSLVRSGDRVRAFAAVAAAITNGVPDGSAHPEVGALLAPQAFSDGTWEECTGTLIAPRVFLTAAHCDEGLGQVKVTFDSNYVAPGTTYYRHLARRPGASARHTATRTTSPSSCFDQRRHRHHAGAAAEARPARHARGTAIRSRRSATAPSR